MFDFIKNNDQKNSYISQKQVYFFKCLIFIYYLPCSLLAMTKSSSQITGSLLNFVVKTYIYFVWY